MIWAALRWIAVASFSGAACVLLLLSASRARANRAEPVSADRAITENARLLLDEGRRVFRFETFGDEAFWGDTLKLHQAIAGSKLGGVGPGVSPNTALSVGLKVDVDAVPAAVAAALKAGKVDLDDPASTIVLLKANAVVGISGHFGDNGQLSSLGVQCAFCHSTVDDSFAPGIGHRLDGWANRDLNVGAIISLAPDLGAYTQLLKVDEPTLKTVLASWGPGKFDALLNLDGKAFRPDGGSAATLIPPAFGMGGINQHTWTGGWGNVPYWNAYVANLELNGRGNFLDARLDNAQQYPVAARAKHGHKQSQPDMVSSHMAALDFYQLALPIPAARPGTFDPASAGRGQTAFNGRAQCSTCHVPPLFTEAGMNTHKGSEIGIDDFQSDRSPDRSYRTAPLRGLMSHAKGGFYHDGRFPTLPAVVEHYDQFLKLGLKDAEKHDLVEYLKSL